MISCPFKRLLSAASATSLMHNQCPSLILKRHHIATGVAVRGGLALAIIGFRTTKCPQHAHRGMNAHGAMVLRMLVILQLALLSSFASALCLCSGS